MTKNTPQDAVEACIRRYLDEHVPTLAPGTQMLYKAYSGHATRLWGECRVQELTPERITTDLARSFRNKRATGEYVRKFLSSALNYCRVANPAQHAKKRPQPVDVRILAPSEWSALWSATDGLEEPYRCLYRVALLQPVRLYSELAPRKWTELVNLGPGWAFRLPTRKNRGAASTIRDHNTVYLHPKSYELISLLEPDTLAPDYVWGNRSRTAIMKRWDKLREISGVAWPTTRHLKHTAATIARDAGIDQYVAAAVCGTSPDALNKFYQSTSAGVALDAQRRIGDALLAQVEVG